MNLFANRQILILQKRVQIKIIPSWGNKITKVLFYYNLFIFETEKEKYPFGKTETGFSIIDQGLFDYAETRAVFNKQNIRERSPEIHVF